MLDKFFIQLKESKKILIISPAFPPAINGLGDYAYILGRELSKHQNLNVFYAGLLQFEEPQVTPYDVICKKNSIEQIVRKHKIAIVFINYVNYGYQKKGVPFWLLNSIRNLQSKKVQVQVYFHELYASSNKPWQLVFWLKPLQIYIYDTLARYAEYIFCSNDVAFNILKKRHLSKLIKLGIYSNIVEPKTLVALSQRQQNAVIFGTFARRKIIYEHWQKLDEIIRLFKISKIIDIGPGDVIVNRELAAPIIKMGIMANEDLAKLISMQKFGLISYPDAYLGKSGIFAAYSSYGMIIINFDNNKQVPSEGLDIGQHYISARSSRTFHSIKLQMVSEEILKWYSNRSIKEHVNFIYNIILKRNIN